MGMKDILGREIERINPLDDELAYLEKVAKDFIFSLKDVGFRAFLGGEFG